MGWMSAEGVSEGARRADSPQTVQVSSIYGGHSPDQRRQNEQAQADGAAKPPIEVEWTSRGYRLVDGCDRVHFAREAGEQTIRAYVWEAER